MGPGAGVGRDGGAKLEVLRLIPRLPSFDLRPDIELPSWRVALDLAGRWADEADHIRAVPVDPLPDVPSPGAAASAWALAKATATVVGAPFSIPVTALAGRRAQRSALARIRCFADHLEALAGGDVTPLPAPRRARLSSNRRVVITSDLHRCIPGRLDWPARQGTKGLYHRVLSEYAEQGWDLLENGDVEDFWMVGGSTWGAVYDVARIGSGVGGLLAEDARRELIRQHLDRIVDNNASTYRLLREGFGADGRYHRTMGNHDDVYVDEVLVQHLGEHLPGVEVVDTVLLTRPEALDRPDGGDGSGIDGVDAFVAHGHLTDAWNGPGWAFLGRAITWLATAFDDLPGLGAAVTGLPDETGLGRLLRGQARNRLITLDPRFGGNRRFDSLDEERLFADLAERSPRSGAEWPWLLFGHTHLPMLEPLSAAGRPTRYANSGTALLEGAISLLEWDPDVRAPRLVVWTDEPGGPRRNEMVPDGMHLVLADRAGVELV